MTKLEEIARAIYPVMVSGGDHEGVPLDEAFSRWRNIHVKQRAIALARASVEAMRDPGDAAIRAGVDHRLTTHIGAANKWPDDTRSLWQAMIDAILNEGKT